MEKIYLDHACTSGIKAPGVAEEFCNYYTKTAVNIGRSSYFESVGLEERVYDVRNSIASFFGTYEPQNVVFTKNITESLNVVLKGFLKPTDHVLVSSMEHNAVMRPIVQLEKQGLCFSRIYCDQDGNINLSSIQGLIRENTKAIVCIGASNVCGTCMPLKEIGEICKNNKIRFIVDSAQIAGFSKIDALEMNIDALCFTGHKGLLGPNGIGGIVFSKGMEKIVEPLISGGTGSMSDSEEVPPFMPDRYEAGTLNIPGILGLGRAIDYVQSLGLDAIKTRELKLTQYFIDGLKQFEDRNLLKIVGKHDTKNRCAVISIVISDKDMADIAYKLDSEFGIMTRVGLHCAPSAHKTLNTFPCGTIRFSFGYNNTEEEIDKTINALKELLWK